MTTRSVHETRVHWNRMKNITFSADESAIERARDRARRERKTLNVAFREWLERYAGSSNAGAEFDQMMRTLSHVKFSRKFTRDEMNSR
jgi:hypothetical protein